MRRIIFSITIFLFSLSSVMGQMIPINLPADGNWPTIVGDSIMIIGPRQNELTEEQRYFNPVYLMTYPGKEYLKAQMIRAGACDCDPTKPNRRIGVFSVAPDKQVSFSQGNLQYLPAINLWKFANSQYEYLGNANKYLKPTFRNWVDLFGWSASNTTAPFGVSTSTNAADYAGDFVDWGTNAICGDAPGTWRTLSIEEWEYIYHGRKNADQLLAIATLEGVPGLILLPDNWQQPEDIPFVSSVEQGLAWDATIVEGSYFDATNKDHTKDNIYTQAQWQKMEALGAVFLPCAGWRQEKTWTHAGIVEVNIKYLGSYWSCSTPQISNDYYFFRFTQQEIRKFPLNNSLSLLARGRSVRLVHDTIVPESIPEPCLVVKVNDTLSINMMCVEGGTFTMGDGENAHPVSLSSYSIGQTEVTQALWETVMGTNPSANTANKQLPVTNISWYDCQEFIKKLNQQTGMRFRLPTEAEWEYAARGGQRSKGYTYAGSNDINDVAWYVGNAGAKSHIVGTKLPNELGIFDMSGNIWEWCAETFDENDDGQEEGAVHGGAWDSQASTCRVISSRAIRAITYAVKFIGFRLVHDADFTQSPEPEYVDLGLSVKWATFNVGATSPEDYGDYFAWGETEPKETYSWTNYKWCDGDYTKLNKYCTKVQYGIVDNQTILQLCDDAAHTKLGGNWRMPTMEECQELVNLCTWTWTTINGISGHVITGPNGNTIFLPATGAITTSGLQNAGESGYYWINSISTTSPYNANDIYNQPSTYGINAFSRYIGRPIRPVYDDRPPKRIGVFSVATDKKVSFSQGNLQYVQSTDTWQFAREQYELIGEDYTTLGIWDLFGWSGKDNNAPFGVSESANVVDYRGEFVDWGKNRIGNDAPATWRTLSRYEWQYLIEIRPKADELYGVAMVAGVQGMILLPDDWVCPEGIIFNHGCHAKDNVENFAKHQTFSQEQWSMMEEAGAIFLPAAGIIYPPSKTITSVAGGAHYYSSDQKDADNAIFFGFRSSYYTINSSANRIRRSVRLVHDTIVQKVEPEAVDLGLSVKWATFNVGATSPEDYGDYFAWGETETKDKYSWVTYKWCDGTSTNMTKYNTEDGKTILEPADDAAQVHWGGKWRMPSKEEVDELTQQCSWIWTTHNNVNGYKVTGPNGNSIFLPAAGYKGSGPTYPAGEDGLYWTNTIEKGHYSYLIVLHNDAPPTQAGRQGTRCFGFTIRPVYDDSYYCYGFTQEDWDAATASWGHGGRGHAPADQSCIQGTRVHGIRLKVAKAGSLNVYKVPSLLEKNEDHFELVATLTTDSTGVQDFDFAEPIYIAPNEYLVFGKPSEETPTLQPCYINNSREELPAKAKGFAHFIGLENAKTFAPYSSLMVEFY